MFISHSIVLAGLKVCSFTLGRPGFFSPVLFPAVAVGSIRLPRTQLHSQKRSALQGQTPPRGAHSRKASENVVFGVVKQVSGPGGPGGGSGLPCFRPGGSRGRVRIAMFLR